MQQIRKVCIVGAGAIGSLFAGHLGACIETTVLTRREAHARDLNEHGLRVSGKSDLHARVRASTDPAELGDVDLVILATKATAVEDSARVLQGYFPRARILLVQNGLGCEEVVHRFGEWPLISGVTFMSGVRHSDVHVEYELDTATWLGPWAEHGPDYAFVREVEALLDAEIHEALSDRPEGGSLRRSAAPPVVETDLQLGGEQHLGDGGSAACSLFRRA
ncbi:MAG TPA: 2-dehydropantoate 2-reductase N-terminal domain-containing protein [Pseudomonadales bacterium]|nr:2-dehydropantoate 2-reductase N-terminal domain-containing protein [Pseudomonadales bacterium]